VLTKSSRLARWQDYYYNPVEEDWGPYNLSNITVFCRRMKAMLEDPALQPYELWCYTSDEPKMRTNIAMLMTAFSVIVLGIEADNAARSPERLLSLSDSHPLPLSAFRYLSHHTNTRVQVETYPAYTPFPDHDHSTLGNISITSCLFALEKAIELGWYDYNTFDVEDYEATPTTTDHE